MSDWWIRLHFLDCNDAQEREDEPYIVLNGRRVWGPHSMRTGNKEKIDGVKLELDRGDQAEIQLWEQDRRGDERIGTEIVRFRDIRIWEESFSNPHTEFSRSGRGFRGDARYTLWYALGNVHH